MIQKIIKKEEDYQAALSRIDELMDAEPNTLEGDELELLVTLVELYEGQKYPIDMPDAVEAIKFRMEQSGLNQQDLVPFMGSKSKVSEVLNRKRPLSLSMMRALHKGLDIPAEILLQEQGRDFPEEIPEIEWKKFSIKEMMNLGWIPPDRSIDGNEEDIMRRFIQEGAGMNNFTGLSFRVTKSSAKKLRTDRYALMAWCLRLMELSKKHLLQKKYKPGSIDLSEVSKLSYFRNGPLLAKEYLEKQGVQFFIVPHLNKTYLDGAVMVTDPKNPVIALTLRYDRIDNFWFCLLHELAHLIEHMTMDETNIIVDELEPRHSRLKSQDTKEEEADRIAQNALIPEDEWKQVNLDEKNLARVVIGLSEKLKIHPAIVAGRIRFEKNNYRILSQFLGRGEVKQIYLKGDII
ncbi:MAG: ImmA/IrrE family metallo-endopeptidase [Candidatus Aminicenantes bacterium]|nr:ImmA/IrrE family metallo-endopeptidase [Candidatus Aminicenantes bacterium]